MHFPLRLAIAASLCAFALLEGADARANGRFPAADHLVVSQMDPNVMVLRTTFGILISKDHGANWDWVCEKAVGYGGVEDPAIGITATSAILAGTFEGLAVSQNVGCDWAFVGGGLQDQVIIDLVVRPNALHESLALTNKYATATEAGQALFSTQLFASSDDAKSWAAMGPAIDPTLIAETVEVAASDPARIYISAARDVDGVRSGVFIASSDRGATWTEHAIALDGKMERAPFIAAVDPKNPLRVYVRTAGPKDTPSRLLVTDDGGATFRVAFAGKGEMLGFALSPDGTKVFVGGPLDGLQVASSTALTFAKKSAVKVQCLATSGATLYACSAESSGFILGASGDDGATFSPTLHLATLRGPLACSTTSSQAKCVRDWPTLREGLGVSDLDASVAAEAGSDADAVPPQQVNAGGGCGGCAENSAGGSATTLVGSALALAGAIALVMRRLRARVR